MEIIRQWTGNNKKENCTGQDWKKVDGKWKKLDSQLMKLRNCLTKGVPQYTIG